MIDPELRLGAEADAEACARLHEARIDEGFLATLGVPFLTRLYRRIVRDPDSFLIVAAADGRVVGFVSGTASTRRLYKQFARRDGVAAGLRAAPRLVRSLRRVIETLRYPRRDGGGASDAPEAELLSLAVAANSAGQGVGGMLTVACLAEFGHRGIGAARVVVSATNGAGRAVYRAHGFAPHTEIEVHKGERSEVLVWRA